MRGPLTQRVVLECTDCRQQTALTQASSGETSVRDPHMRRYPSVQMQPDTYQNASRSPSVRSATELHPVPWRLHTRLHTSQAHLTSRAFYCGPSALRFVLGDEAEVGVRCFEPRAGRSWRICAFGLLLWTGGMSALLSLCGWRAARRPTIALPPVLRATP